MNINQWIVILKNGGELLTEYLRSRPIKRKAPPPTQPLPATEEIDVEVEPQRAIDEGKNQQIKDGTACLPCTNSHLYACVGLLNEAVRMSPDGLTPESLRRVDKCLGEIVAAERIDLTPENVSTLPPEEKVIAKYAAKELREIRHSLEAVANTEALEETAARTAKLQSHIASEWFKYRLRGMNQ